MNGNVISAVAVLGTLGAVFGLVLAIAAKIFAVEVDERQEAIIGVLPGANCGGCGYPGCSGYASAIIGEGAAVTRCAAGGAAVAAQIAEIMGIEAGNVTRTVAAIRCSGTAGKVQKKFDYIGIKDCLAASRINGGPNVCADGCLGFGTCIKACQFDAIYIKDGIAKINHEKCVGCMACSAACPKSLIVGIPYESEVFVPCASTARGADVRKFCEAGCIGCKGCEKQCEYDAVAVNNNLSAIDASKCTNCGKCAANCPRKLIYDSKAGLRDKAVSA